MLKVLWLEDPKWREPNRMMGGLPALKVAYGLDVESKLIDGEVVAVAGQNGCLGQCTRRLLRFSARWRMR